MKMVLLLGVVFALGTVFGVCITCCFVSAGNEDRRLEKLNKTEADTK